MNPFSEPDLRSDLSLYPRLVQMLRVTAQTVPGPSGFAQVAGSSVLGPSLYVAFTQQMRTDGSLLPRDREPCLVDDVNGFGLSPGFYTGRLAGTFNSLPVYTVGGSERPSILKRTYTSTGTSVWVRPTDPTFAGIDIICIGGGGAVQMAATVAGQINIVGGGGGGGGATRRVLASQINGNLNVVVALGSIGSGGVNGAGGTSSVYDVNGANTWCVAGGGGDAVSVNNLTASSVAGGGGSGAGTIGDIVTEGDQGDSTYLLWNTNIAGSMCWGGGGGGSAFGFGQHTDNKIIPNTDPIDGFMFQSAGSLNLYVGYGAGASGGAKGRTGIVLPAFVEGGQQGVVVIHEYYGINLNQVNIPPTPWDGATLQIEDMFVGTNGTNLTGHAIAPTNVPGTVWTQLNASAITIQSNNAQTNSATAHDSLDSGVTNKTITVTLRYSAVGNNDLGASTRVQDSSNYYYGLLSPTNSKIEIHQVSSGVDTLLNSTAFTPAPNTDYLATLQESGNTLTFIVSGTQISTTMTLLSGVKKCGILTASSGGGAKIWKDYKITSP